MKATKTIATMFLAAGLAAGQAAPAKKPAAPASQSTTTKPAAPATKPAAQPATKAAAQPAGKTAAKTPATAAKPAATPAKPAEMSASQAAAVKGKRDPFLSPVVSRMPGSKATAACSTGKRCLIIDQLTLQGVVKTQSGWIAVVGNPAKKVYYLRANDAVFDGFVMRIDGDSVVFKQNTLDAMGKQTQKEVVKRVGPVA